MLSTFALNLSKPAANFLWQRNCACGSPAASLTGQCEECKSREVLQTKLTIGASDDPLEREADRIAEQVVGAGTDSSVGYVPPHVQRYAVRAGSQSSAPVSVNRALARAGYPLEPALRQDMERRFGHGFSQMRVHLGPEAEQSPSRSVSRLIQRKCSCGNTASSLSGECEECQSRGRLQAKLTIAASNDPLEQEADRIADQVVAARTDSAVGYVRPRIQRYTGIINMLL